jgi:membrane protease YdiL (CAAX protease family)
VVAVIVAITAALIGRSWVQVEMLADGLQKDYAADLSYLVVPPILLILLAPVLYKDKSFLILQLRRKDLSWRIILNAVGVGLLIRILWWGQLVASISFGFYVSDNPFAVEGPLFRFQCASPQVVALGFLVMAAMIPIIEEFAHRAYVQSALHRRGPIIAIFVSALVFAVFHPPTSWVFTFLAGIVFGIQYWNSRSLWPSLISHATVNALIQVDWRCLNGQWNPPPSELPMWQIGIPAACVLILASLSICWLTRTKMHRGG